MELLIFPANGHILGRTLVPKTLVLVKTYKHTKFQLPIAPLVSEI